MICLRKICTDELLRFALLLSLLRINPEYYFENDWYNIDIDNIHLNIHSESGRNHHLSRDLIHDIHPKSYDNYLLSSKHQLFTELNSLGHYTPYLNQIAYLLSIERPPLGVNTTFNGETVENLQPEQLNQSVEVLNETVSIDAEEDLGLSQEDMDLIEVLWKQDVDLGFSLQEFDVKSPESDVSPKLDKPVDNDDIEKLKALKSANQDIVKEETEDASESQLWDSVNYIIDKETGEYVIKEETDLLLSAGDSENSCSAPLGDLSLPLSEFLLDEPFDLISLEDDADINKTTDDTASAGSDAVVQNVSEESTASLLKDLQADEDLSILTSMIQTTHLHHGAGTFQGRMPYLRTQSMEQRWQDLANLLSLQNPNDTTSIPLPHSLHNSDAQDVLLHNATLTPPMGDLNFTFPFTNVRDVNFGNTASAFLNLTNSSEPLREPSGISSYKLEPPAHSLINSSLELNQSDGFLSELLNDEDLQLMDMATNDDLYMKLLDEECNVASATVRADVECLDMSRDSAVSSMGSERTSEGDWCEGGGADFRRGPVESFLDFHIFKDRFDYTYSSKLHNGTQMNLNGDCKTLKKYQMYGKGGKGDNDVPLKYEHEDPSTSYSDSDSIFDSKSEDIDCCRNITSCDDAISHIQHNHTYHLPAENVGAMQRPLLRDKPRHKYDDKHLTRDEKRARALKVPISVDDVINLPMDEFNERLSKYDLTESQLSLVRDIRRRGKNKVAAQNCRKRKLDQILSLADEVKEIRDRKLHLLGEQDFVTSEHRRIKVKYEQLYRHVFQNLRDPDGNPYSPFHYSLQTSDDGSVVIVPNTNSTSSNNSKRKHLPHQRKEQ